MMFRISVRLVGVFAIALSALAAPGVVAPSATASGVVAAPIYGQGPTWSQPAVQQWAADVATPRWGSLNVNYQGTGSTAGRDAYISGSADFGVSEIPFQAAYSTPGQPVID